MTKFIQVITALILLLANQVALPIEQDDYQLIPDAAIRLRILAQSDDPSDQELKLAVRDNVSEEITEWVEELTEIEVARKLIQNNLDQVEKVVKETVAAYDSDLDFQVAYDSNVLFPAKLYDQFVYPAGEYEAILITLGEGEGSNWWCVLFPPLCFLDFSSGATVSVDGGVDTEEVEEEEEDGGFKISFFFLEWFNWFK